MMLSVALLLIAQVSISVDAGELSGELETMIRAEIPGAVMTSSAAAQIIVSVKRTENERTIDVVGPEGPMGRRTVHVSEGTEPALRVAALLTARAVELVRAPEEILEIPPPPSELSLYATAELLSTWWNEPFTPSLGFGVSAGVDLRTVHAGLLFAELGVPCCDRSIARIRGETRELLLLADVSFSPIRWGRLWMHVRGSGGLDWVTVDATARVAGAPSTVIFATRRVSTVEGVLRGGISADMELIESKLWFGLGAGAWWRLGPRPIQNLDGDQLFSGHLNPYVEARFRLNFL